MNQNTNNKPMSDLLAALAEQCCKLEHDEPWRPYAHFDRSRAETLIANWHEESIEEHPDYLAAQRTIERLTKECDNCLSLIAHKDMQLEKEATNGAHDERERLRKQIDKLYDKLPDRTNNPLVLRLELNHLLSGKNIFIP